MEHGSKQKTKNKTNLFNKSSYKDIEPVVTGELYEDEEEGSESGGGTPQGKTKQNKKVKTNSPRPKMGGK